MPQSRWRNPAFDYLGPKLAALQFTAAEECSFTDGAVLHSAGCGIELGPRCRQVRIEGTVERMGAAQALKYFLLRPRASQLAAWASAQSRPLSSRALLEDEFARLKQKFGEGRIPLPSFWGGFRVVPDAFEFWQGRPNRLHDRFSYTLADDGQWRIERLAP